jgi:hypothetical protein
MGAYHQEKEFFVLKAIKKNRIESYQHADHVKREKLLHLKLTRESPSPYIVKAFSSFQDSGTLYLQLEFIKGCNLFN